MPNKLDTDIGEAGKLMSGGEKLRLSIAIGILRCNKILLLDEVTSFLDEEIENQLSENFNGLIKKGYTIVSISHRIAFLKYATKIIEIKDGRVCKTGKYKDFIDQKYT